MIVQRIIVDVPERSGTTNVLAPKVGPNGLRALGGDLAGAGATSGIKVGVETGMTPQAKRRMGEMSLIFGGGLA